MIPNRRMLKNKFANYEDRARNVKFIKAVNDLTYPVRCLIAVDYAVLSTLSTSDILWINLILRCAA